MTLRAAHCIMLALFSLFSAELARTAGQRRAALLFYALSAAWLAWGAVHIAAKVGEGAQACAANPHPGCPQGNNHG